MLKTMNFIHKLTTLTLLLICVASLSAQNPADFTLISATDDGQFTLSEARGKFVALHFLLKTECPVCIRHTQDYFSKAETLPDVEQVFIKPDTDKEIEAWSDNLSEEFMKFPIYRDPDAKLADQFNIPDGYEFHNQIVHFPALILFDSNGKEVFRYIGKNNRDRYSFDQLESKISELKN
jgi:peroxiredoxin Q/BCP